ncbi:TIGR04211 family SH3 domain-containing protein [Amphritea sp. HPY]|uniref:TIGR04211 family SH3 domain-containing protein n=1 Tax=Amphritea sp. HPY TaxID=3421652 RepID=UPI003D7DB7BC
MYPQHLPNATADTSSASRLIRSFYTFVFAAIVVTFSTYATTSFAAPAYISDDVYTFYHGGPSDQYKISGRIRSGTAITILKRNTATKYVQIKTPSGRTGWIHEDNVTAGTSLSVRFPGLQEQLKSSEAMLTQQTEEIRALKQQSGGLEQQNSGYSQKIAALEEQIVTLNRSIDGMDESNLMRWFTYGGLVAFGGLILGLMIPFLPKRRKRRDTW